MSISPKTLKNNNDPFTDLPDCLIHAIISFLDKKDFIRLRSVSKRFMKICLTSPYLSFVSKTCPEHTRPSKNYCKKLHKFLVKFLSDRDPSMDIIRIRIECICSTCKFISKRTFLAHSIYEVVKHNNVQELYLKLSFPISMSILNKCKSLTVLKLSCDYYFYSSPGIVFPSVRILSLNGDCWNEDDDLRLGINGDIIAVKYVSASMNKDDYDDDNPNRVGLFEWISNSFPSLKIVYLAKVAEKKIFFKSSTVEEMIVRFSPNHDDKKYNISIFMENLESLTLECPVNYRVLNNIVRITAPNLRDFKLTSGCEHCEFETEFSHLLRKACLDVPAYCNYLVALHRSITWATSLEINILAFETLSKNDASIQIMRENLHYLILNVDDEYSKNDEYIRSIISYLELFHNIKSITIKHTPFQIRYGPHYDQISEKEKYLGNMKLDEGKDLKLFRSLKEVVVEICTGTKELELVKYLLKYAESLEKVTVFHTRNLTNMVSCIDFRNFEIASSSLELFVELKDSPCEEEDN